MQEVQQMADVTEEMEEVEIRGEAEEMDHLLPHEIQLRKQEEEEAVRNAIEKARTAAYKKLKPPQRSNIKLEIFENEKPPQETLTPLHSDYVKGTSRIFYPQTSFVL